MAVTCKWCGTDDYVELAAGDGLAVCTGPGHPTERVWEPAAELIDTRLPTLPDGVAATFGLHEDLPECLREGEWADTAVVEHRYGLLRPDVYAQLIDRWGHVAMGKRRYSVTSFIGKTLGDLSRVTNVTYRKGKGTGFFSYNRSLGHWTLEPVQPSIQVMTWERYAVEHGFDPGDWPLLDYSVEVRIPA